MNYYNIQVRLSQKCESGIKENLSIAFFQLNLCIVVVSFLLHSLCGINNYKTEWVHAKTENGETCLHLAGIRGSTGVTQLLLEKGADPDVRSEFELVCFM